MLISFLPLYLKGCPGNILQIKPSSTFCLFYLSVIALQFIVMVAQRVKGPRFMIPKRYRPNSYDYIRRFHAVEDLESAALSDSSHLNDECIICMHNLRFEVDDAMQLIDGTSVRSKHFMQTPCNHKFHEVCLSSWMKVKLECPVCRSSLPPNADD